MQRIKATWPEREGSTLFVGTGTVYVVPHELDPHVLWTVVVMGGAHGLVWACTCFVGRSGFACDHMRKVEADYFVTVAP